MKKSKLSSKFQSRTEFFSPKKIYLINKKKREEEKKNLSKNVLNHSQSLLNFVPNLPARWREFFRRKIVDGVGGFDAKCRPGPTIHPEKYDANLSTFNSPPFYLFPRRASRQYSTQKEHKFRIFYSKVAGTTSVFSARSHPLLIEGESEEGKIGVATPIAIPLSRGFVLEKIKLLLANKG